MAPHSRDLCKWTGLLFDKSTEVANPACTVPQSEGDSVEVRDDEKWVCDLLAVPD